MPELIDKITGKSRPIRIALDFDGVLHSYISGYTGPIPMDPPVPSAQFFCQELLNQGYELVIFTTRVHPELDNTHKFVEIVDRRAYVDELGGEEEKWVSRKNKGLTLGEDAIRQWLRHWKFPAALCDAQITHKKEHSDLFVDDRGFRFSGCWAELMAFLRNNPRCETWVKEQ